MRKRPHARKIAARLRKAALDEIARDPADELDEQLARTTWPQSKRGELFRSMAYLRAENFRHPMLLERFRLIENILLKQLAQEKIDNNEINQIRYDLVQDALDSGMSKNAAYRYAEALLHRTPWTGDGRPDGAIRASYRLIRQRNRRRAKKGK